MSQFKIHGETDVGRVRDNNEDCIDWYLSKAADSALAVVADGVGGFAGGEIASRLAIEHTCERICKIINQDSQSWDAESARMVWRVMDAVADANEAIFSVRSKNAEIGRMGTTLVTALAHGDNLCIAHVGDSRCYRFRDRVLEQLTLDHSMAQELCGTGIVGKNMAYRNVLTRTLGVERCVEPEVTMQHTAVNDIYLLCSDGLSSYIDDEMISNILEQEAELPETVSKLVSIANDAGGQDNISVVLIQRTA